MFERIDIAHQQMNAVPVIPLSDDSVVDHFANQPKSFIENVSDDSRANIKGHVAW